jgi:hypothetical protein
LEREPGRWNDIALRVLRRFARATHCTTSLCTSTHRCNLLTGRIVNVALSHIQKHTLQCQK